MSKGNGAMIGAVVLTLFFLYLRSQVGDQAALYILFYFAGIITGVVMMAIGGRLNDSNQRNFIDLMKHSKSAMTATVREEARTQGAMDRAQLRQVAPPLNVSPDMQDWINRTSGKMN
jgi:uncharacterized protein YacL